MFRKKISTELSEPEIEALMKALERDFPSPKPVLAFHDRFELLCAVMLSAQTTDAAVNKVTPALFALAPDAGSMAKLDEAAVGSLIKSLGLWRAKAKNLIALSKILTEQFAGEVPGDYESLIKLPGVGSKTALVVLNVGFGQPTVAVDTHILRVCSRTGLCPLKEPLKISRALPALIPAKYLKEAHHRLLFHGRLVCRARNPLCEICSLKSVCRKHL